MLKNHKMKDLIRARAFVPTTKTSRIGFLVGSIIASVVVTVVVVAVSQQGEEKWSGPVLPRLTDSINSRRVS